jgi:hypothetical protein
VVVEKGLDPPRQAMDSRALLPHSTIHLFVGIETLVVIHEPGAKQPGDDVAHGPGDEGAGMDDVKPGAEAQTQRLEQRESGV